MSNGFRLSEANTRPFNPASPLGFCQSIQSIRTTNKRDANSHTYNPQTCSDSVRHNIPILAKPVTAMLRWPRKCPTVQQPDNQGSLSHEVLAGGAAFMAMREYLKHEEANGSPTPSISSPAPRLIIRISCWHSFLPGVAENHTVAKDILAGLAGGEADKLMETHGENFCDRERMRYGAKEQANSCYDQ